MRICKFLAAALSVAFGLGLTASNCFAADFPSMPSIESPSMPSLSPSSGPPTPWRGGAPYIPSQQNNSAAQQTDSTDTTTDAKDTAAGLALTAQSISGLGGLEALEELTGLGGLTGLTGLDGLSGTNSLDALEKALKAVEQSGEKKSDSGDTATIDSETAATLQQILQQLKILAAAKSANQSQSAPSQTATPQSQATTAATSTNSATASSSAAPTNSVAGAAHEPQEPENLSPSRILRFRTNKGDILDTCKTVYFSQPDPAGIFLLTGDRVYYAGGKPYNETFYFLFKPTLDEGGKFMYQVEAEIMQDVAATSSNLYPLTEQLPLTATRTGNLVTLRHSTENWNLDLLLDLREVYGE